MKKLILLFLSLAAVVSANVMIPKKIKPAKQELPEIIIPTESESPHILKPIQYKYEDRTKFCPRDDMNYKQYNESFYQTGNAEDAVVIVHHCERCNIGVYSEHKEEEGKRCTYCGDREPTIN